MQAQTLILKRLLNQQHLVNKFQLSFKRYALSFLEQNLDQIWVIIEHIIRC